MRFIYRVTLILFFFLICLTPPKISAQTPQFSNEADALYTVVENGSTQVKLDISITNLMSTVYAQEYAFQVSSTTLRDATAFDDDLKPLPLELSRSNTDTTILIRFPDQVIGRDAKRSFTLSFAQDDLATRYGQVLEVDIPQVTDLSSFSRYGVKVRVPSKYGQASFINPAVFSEAIEDDWLVYSFSTGADQGISLLFGRQQFYAFRLGYHAENSAISIGEVQFAIPPDTPYQQVVVTSFSTEPKKISKDKDGNWLATFELAGKQRLDLIVSGYVTVYLEPTIPVPESKPDKQYLSALQYWERLDTLVFPAVESSQQESVRTRARVIYDTVISRLQYDYGRLKAADTARRGVRGAVAQSESALCQEYTDLFISLARSTGIHAREINGYAVTTNERMRPLSLLADVLHAWPEFYDPETQQWISVDPTWGDTTGGVDYFSKLGLSHIAFVRRGLSSTVPFPAGVYKLPNQTEKDVSIEIVEAIPTVAPAFSITKGEALDGQQLILTNETGSAWYDQPLDIATNGNLQIKLRDLETGEEIIAGSTVLIDILPFQTKAYEIIPELSGLKVWSSEEVRFTLGQDTISYELSAQFIPKWLVVVAGAFSLATISWGVLVFFLRKRGGLRRKSKKS